MARFRDFDAYEAERRGETLTFALGGRQWRAEHLNGANFLAFSRRVAEGGNAAATGFEDYLVSTLGESQREPFQAMLVERDIQMPTLLELVKWLTEEATGNPTDAASVSQPVPSNTGQPRKLVLASLDPIPEPTPSAAGS